MEGFLNLRMTPWLRRLITRTLAVIPAAITVYLSGAEGTFKLLIFSQVVLSMQLPFAVIPLINLGMDSRGRPVFRAVDPPTLADRNQPVPAHALGRIRASIARTPEAVPASAGRF
jgi:Mn2+/Fe2+ NRAMP family transporter